MLTEQAHAAPVERPAHGQMLVFYTACGFPISFLSMVMFLVPLRARELGAPLEIIGVIVGVGALLGMAFAVPAGALADRIGPRQAFIMGAALDGLAAAAFFLLEDYWLMLAVQFFRGVPHSMAWVASQTYVATVGRPAEQAALAGRFSFASGVSALLAPLIVGGVAELVGYRASFLFMALFCAFHVVLGLLMADVRSRRPGGRAGSTRAGYGTALALLREPGPQVAVLLTFLRLWISTGWSSFFPLFLLERGFSPVLIGTVVSANGIVSSVTGLGAHWATRCMSAQAATAAALALGAVGIAVSPQLAVMPLVYLPALLMGTSTGLSMPLVMAILGSEVPPGQRGVAMGLRTGANQAGNMLSPMVMGVLVGSLGVPLGFVGSGVFSAVVIVAAVWVHLRSGGTKAVRSAPS